MNKLNQVIELGDKVKDSVSGFTGIVLAQHNYLHGCKRFSVQPAVEKDGKFPDSVSFDEPQLILIAKKKVPVTKPTAKITGGFKPETRMNKPTGDRS